MKFRVPCMFDSSVALMLGAAGVEVLEVFD
jgi:hypothetical protein